MKNFKKAFTLVELIVVITIIAVLGTIAFLSFQNYTAGARDSKRISDINNIFKKVQIEMNKGTPLSDTINASSSGNVTIDGDTGAFSSLGVVDFVAIQEDGDNFKDPSVTTQDYPIAYSQGGTGTGTYKFVQIGTTSEAENDAIVVGNYYKFRSGDSDGILVIGGDTILDGGPDLPYNVLR